MILVIKIDIYDGKDSKATLELSRLVDSILKEDILLGIMKSNTDIESNADALRFLIDELLKQYVRYNMKL